MKREIKTVRTIFEIIEIIKDLDGGRMTDIAAEIDLAESTVYEHLVTLENLGHVVKINDEYQIGLRFLDYGMYAKNRLEWTKAARPTMETLADETDEAVWLVVEENGLGVNLDNVLGEHAVQTVGWIGRRDKLHSFATGKAILAFLPQDRIEEIVEQHRLPPITENTITDVDELYECLETIQDRGYSINDEEGVKGLRAVASPILDDNNHPVGAIGIAGAANRIRNERFTEELPDLAMGAASEIELRVAFDHQKTDTYY